MNKNIEKKKGNISEERRANIMKGGLDMRDYIVKTIKNTLEADKIEYTSRDDEIFDFEIPESVTVWGCDRVIYRILVLDDAFIVYGISSNDIEYKDEEMMNMIARSICRINYDSRVRGDLELDLRDGELRYRFFVDCARSKPTKEVVRQSIYSAGLRIKTFYKEIVMLHRSLGGRKENTSDSVSYGNMQINFVDMSERNVTVETVLDTSDDESVETMLARLNTRFGGGKAKHDNIENTKNDKSKANMFDRKGDVE